MQHTNKDYMVISCIHTLRICSMKDIQDCIRDATKSSLLLINDYCPNHIAYTYGHICPARYHNNNTQGLLMMEG